MNGTGVPSPVRIPWVARELTARLRREAGGCCRKRRSTVRRKNAARRRRCLYGAAQMCYMLARALRTFAFGSRFGRTAGSTSNYAGGRY